MMIGEFQPAGMILRPTRGSGAPQLPSFGPSPSFGAGRMTTDSNVFRFTRLNPRYCELLYSVVLSVVSITLLNPSPPPTRYQSSFSGPDVV